MAKVDFFDRNGFAGKLSYIGSIQFPKWSVAVKFVEDYERSVKCNSYWRDYLNEAIRVEIIGSGRSK